MSDILDAVRRRPADRDLRLVYADWLDDHGRDQEAIVQRWIAAQARRPRALQFYRILHLPRGWTPRNGERVVARNPMAIYGGHWQRAVVRRVLPDPTGREPVIEVQYARGRVGQILLSDCRPEWVP